MKFTGNEQSFGVHFLVCVLLVQFSVVILNCSRPFLEQSQFMSTFFVDVLDLLEFSQRVLLRLSKILKFLKFKVCSKPEIFIYKSSIF